MFSCVSLPYVPRVTDATPFGVSADQSAAAGDLTRSYLIVGGCPSTRVVALRTCALLSMSVAVSVCWAVSAQGVSENELTLALPCAPGADMRIVCHEGAYPAYRSAAIFWLFIYPIGARAPGADRPNQGCLALPCAGRFPKVACVVCSRPCLRPFPPPFSPTSPLRRRRRNPLRVHRPPLLVQGAEAGLPRGTGRLIPPPPGRSSSSRDGAVRPSHAPPRRTAPPPPRPAPAGAPAGAGQGGRSVAAAGGAPGAPVRRALPTGLRAPRHHHCKLPHRLPEGPVLHLLHRCAAAPAGAAAFFFSLSLPVNGPAGHTCLATTSSPPRAPLAPAAPRSGRRRWRLPRAPSAPLRRPFADAIPLLQAGRGHGHGRSGAQRGHPRGEGEDARPASQCAAQRLHCCSLARPPGGRFTESSA